MRILISSHRFFPDVGGIESVSQLLARTWSKAGHTVEIISQTPGQDEWEGLPVLRRPNKRHLWRLISSADVYLQNHLSLQTLWPAFFHRRKTVILHQTYLKPFDQPWRGPSRIKRLAARFFVNLAISQAVARELPGTRAVIGNPYQDDIFFAGEKAVYEADLLFVGRFVSDKGGDVLLRALAELHQTGWGEPSLTLVGDGPEKEAWQKLGKELGIANFLRFVGFRQGEALADTYRSHRVLVVPSTWPEPFGIVALEGLACGCRVIGSDQGGLPEAIGPGGWTFPNGDVGALTQTLRLALQSNASDNPALAQHLEKHRPEIFAEKVLGFVTSR